MSAKLGDKLLRVVELLFSRCSMSTFCIKFKLMNKLKIVYALVLIVLVVLESHIGILPMMIWGLGFPLAAIAKNWRALKFSKKRGGKSKTLDLYEDYYKKDKAEE